MWNREDDPLPNLALDQSRMFDWLKDYPRQLRLLYPLGVQAGKEAMGQAEDEEFTGVLILGTGGGSAAAARIVASLTRNRLKVPVEVAQGYEAPAYVAAGNAHTLVIGVSHSGQTEETLSAVSGLPSKCPLTVITGGGPLAEEASRRKAPCVVLPTGMTARAFMPGIVAALLGILEATGLVGGKDKFSKQIDEAAKLTEELSALWGPVAPEGQPPPALEYPTPLQLARRVVDRMVLVYAGGGAAEGIARRWGNQLAENGKTLAHWNTIPEAHHDEAVGWDAPPYLQEHLYACVLRDPEAETAKMRRRLDVTSELLARRMTGVSQIPAQGQGALARALSLCLYGDYLSCYVALSRGIDPTPVPIIVTLKREVADVRG